MKKVFTFSIITGILGVFQVNAQNVGVDIAAPQQKLDVAGGIRIGNTSTGLAGSMRWTGTQFQVHNGTQWVSLGANTDNQQFDVVQLTGTNLELSLQNDGLGTHIIDLSSLADNTDDQVIDLLQLSGNTLSISLESDGQAPQTVDLSSLADTDDQTVDLFGITSNTLRISLEDDGQAPLSVDLSPYLDNTDDQQLDLFQLSGNNLQISLQNDGQAPQVVDLSSFLDNSDNQVLDVVQLNGTNLELSIEDDGQPTHIIDLSSFADNTDDQTIDAFSLTGTTLNLSLENDGVATQTVNLDPLRRLLRDADADTRVEVEANPDEDQIRFTTASGQRMVIRETGNIGIGVANPQNRLGISGTPTDAYSALGIYSGNAQGDFNNGAQIAFGYNNANQYQHFIHTRHNQIGAANNAIDFYVNAGTTANNTVTSGSTHVMSLNAGNVGIGVTSPSQKLHVSGTGRFTSLAGTGTRLVVADNTGVLQTTTDLPSGDGDYIQNRNTASQTANFWITGFANVESTYRLDNVDVIKGSGTDVYGNIRVLQNSSTALQDGMYINYNSTGGTNADLRMFANGTTERIRVKANTGYVGIGNTDPASLLHVMGKVNIHQSGTGGGQNRFEGLQGPTTANGRGQLVVSSAYSDVVIASSQGNNNHGSTLTFATYNPSDANDYRKFVVNQGNWGSRRGFLDFGYSDAGGRTNPHSNINATDNVLTLDGFNKRVGIGEMTPTNTLHVRRQGSGNWATAQIFNTANNSWGHSLLIRTATPGTDGAKILFRSRDTKNWSAGGEEAGGNGFSINEDGGDGVYGTGFGTPRLFIQEGGFVGINTTTPETTLDVHGNAVITRDGATECCSGGEYTLAVAENTSSTGNRASISFHNSGIAEGKIELVQSEYNMNGLPYNNRRFRFYDHQAPFVGLELEGNLFYGNNSSRTQTRDNNTLQGNSDGVLSGFYETSSATTGEGYPESTNSWYHLLDVRHSNPSNNYAMQIAGSFFDQKLYYRKTNNNGNQAWTEIVGAGGGTHYTMSANFSHSADDWCDGCSGTGALPDGADDVTQVVTMPFSVPSNGTTYNQVSICSNGWVALGSTGATNFGNPTLPTGIYNGPIIAAYWDDLRDYGGGEYVRYGTVGAAPNRTFIIDYSMRQFGNGNRQNFQIQIHETSGLINVKYRNEMSPSTNGQSATIGFQVNSSKAYPIVTNGKVLDDNRDDSEGWSVCPIR
jgi:hypothetical protein